MTHAEIVREIAEPLAREACDLISYGAVVKRSETDHDSV